MDMKTLIYSYMLMGASYEEAKELSLRELCIKKKLSLKKVHIPTPKKKNNKSKKWGITCTDHLGNVYSSLTEMVRHYGIDLYEYEKRRSMRWSVEKALTTPHNQAT